MRAPSLVALVPLVVTILVLAAVIMSTVVTVRRDRRRNTVWALRWAETLRRRRAAAVVRRPVSVLVSPPLPVPVAVPKRDAA